MTSPIKTKTGITLSNTGRPGEADPTGASAEGTVAHSVAVGRADTVVGVEVRGTAVTVGARVGGGVGNGLTGSSGAFSILQEYQTPLGLPSLIHVANMTFP